MAKDNATPPERPEPKPPIYSVAVIEAASRALQAVTEVHGATEVGILDAIQNSALRIIRDGLASHERAIRGEL
jgi:hypothetical protein